jgi:hypothetical protein
MLKINTVNYRQYGREAVVYHGALRHGEPGKSMPCYRVMQK